MLVLLPPSESKSPRARGKALDLTTLSFPELTDARAKVLEALAEVSGRGDAHEILGVSPNLSAEVARNTVLGTAPAPPAGDVYSGVLYDALDLASLDAGARRRANRWLVVISALFGAVHLRDRIPPYRLSMAVNLPGVGPLAGHWRSVLDSELSTAAGSGLIVDCRSSTYIAAWQPTGELAHHWVQVRVPGATHMAKHTRGLVARQLLQVDREPRTARALARALTEHFDVDLTEPTGAGRPWLLDASVKV